MDGNTERKGWGRGTWTSIVLALYVLSMGPAWWLADNVPHCYGLVTAAYTPILFLIHFSDPFADAVIWYLGFWSNLPA